MLTFGEDQHCVVGEQGAKKKAGSKTPRAAVNTPRSAWWLGAVRAARLPVADTGQPPCGARHSVLSLLSV
jgi:hypothetical protein